MQLTLARWLNIKWPLDEKAAQGCLLLNLLAWPGLGSLLARRKSGGIQMAMSLLGIFSVVWALQKFTAMMIDETRYPTWHDSFIWLAIGGVASFVLAWVWALFTSLSIRKEAIKNATPPPLPKRI